MPAQKSRLIGALAVLSTLALLASCRGFFVNPTLTAVSVGPQNLQLNFNQTWQMAATGTYSDGTQKTLTSGVTWSATATPTTALSIGQSSGVVTAGAVPGSATVTASAGSCSGCSGSTTVTVVLQGVTSITVDGGGQTIHTSTGTPTYFTALANGSVDITNSGAVWTVVNTATGTDQTSDFSLSFVSGSGEGIAALSTTPVGAYTVKATYNNVVGTATLAVATP